MRRFAALLAFAWSFTSAAVTRIELVHRDDVQNGQPFGAAGPYEAITARAFFEVEPGAPANKGIALLDRVPRNASGRVEFSADVYIVRPRDAAKANGTALVEISNRGGKGLNATFDLGDRFLYEHGFTLVWIGWEFDVPPPNPEKLKLYAPVATNGGVPIQAPVLAEWTGDERVDTISLGDRAQVAYAAANPVDPANRMYVRDHVEDPRRSIPRADWSFADDRHVTLKAGFEPGKIYEVVYMAKDPVVGGLGLAAIRDMVSFLKYGGPETLLSEEHGILKRAIGFGVSQSGRFLREYLYEGFNADEQNRRIFDGVWAHVAGAGRGETFDMPFGQPSRDGHPFLNVFYPVDIPPFTPEGLLAHTGQNAVPKIFLSNGSYEYWGRAASLIHTSIDGKQDVAPPPNVRIYMFAGAQHGAGSVPPRKPQAQNLADTNDYRTSMRALLLRMDAWIRNVDEPPASAYPMIGKDQLVAIGALAFPHIAGIDVPHRKRAAYKLDFSVEPPRLNGTYPTLVPQVDRDGNETSGIRMPEIQVPLASYTGWNLRSASIGAPDELFSMTGSWIPFPRTRAERENKKDPRLSIEERYPTKDAYLAKITAAAQQLEKQSFLRDEYIPKLRQRAAKEWDFSDSMP